MMSYIMSVVIFRYALEYDIFLEEHQHESNEKSLGESSLHMDMYGSQDFEMNRLDHQVRICSTPIGEIPTIGIR